MPDVQPLCRFFRQGSIGVEALQLFSPEG